MELPQALVERFRTDRSSRLSGIDGQPAEIRALVHEFNWAMVKAFLDAGILDARQIRHLICRVIEGAAAGNPQDGSGLDLSAPTALELAVRPDIVVCRMNPPDPVVRASMEAVLPYVPGTPLLTKRQKHTIRLKAALEAAKAMNRL